MYPRIMKRMKKLVQDLQYVMTIHAEEEMSDDGLTIVDIESAILTGKITKRQKYDLRCLRA